MVVILSCKCRCVNVNVLDLDFRQCDVVYGWIWMLMSMFLMNIVNVYGFVC
jgi:hypothetical protein